MAINYVTIQDSNFSAGVDSTSPENTIKETFVQQATNCIPDVSGSLKTRTGYITYGGGLPVRVISIEPTTGAIRLILDNSITVASLVKRPIYVYGRTSYQLQKDGGGEIAEFKNDSDSWYYVTTPTTDISNSVGPGTTGTITIESYKTGFTTSDVIVGVSEVDLTTTVQDIMTFPGEGLSVDQSTFTITTDITNGTAVLKTFYVYYVDPASTGESYIAPSTFPAASFTSQSTWTLDTSSSSLVNNNFIIRCYDTSGNLLQPGSLSFNNLTGIITATFEDGSGPVLMSGKMVIVTADTSDFEDLNVPPSSTASWNITRAITDEVLIVDLYQTEDGINYTQVSPDEIVYDVREGYPLTLNWVNGSTSTVSIRAFWKSATQAAKAIITIPITDCSSAQAVDTAPQLVVYGLDHEEIYTSAAEARAGWVSHIDRYRTSTTDRMVAGLGFNQFHAIPLTPTDTQYVKHYINLRSRVSAAGTYIIGPALSSGDQRTNANILSASVSTNYTLLATEITQAAEDITFTTTLSGTLTGSLSDLGSYVTISQAPSTDLIGSHKIKSITGSVVGPAISSISITITLAKGAIVDYTKYSGIAIEWGIFTDTIKIEEVSPLLPNDAIYLTGFEDIFTSARVVSSYQVASEFFLDINNITEHAQIPNRMLMYGTRTTDIVPLRDFYELGISEPAFNIVPGDMVSFSNNGVEQRVQSVVAQETDALTTDITCTVTSGMCTLAVDLTGTGFDTSYFKVGDKVILLNIGVYSGEYHIGVILTDRTFTTVAKGIEEVDGTTTLSNGYFQGSLINIWGANILIADSSTNTGYVTIPVRWEPVEPVDGYVTQVKQYKVSGYDDMTLPRSIMAQDSMFLTNGEDPIYKYDGVNYHLAGLPAFNPQCFVTVNSSVSGKIPIPIVASTIVTGNKRYDENAAAGYWKKIPVTSFSSFKIGDIVTLDHLDGSTTQTAVIEDIESNQKIAPSSGTTDVIADMITLSTTLKDDGSNPTTLSVYATNYQYYFKFYMVDRSNNRIQSATLGYSDCIVPLRVSSRVQFRLVGLPMVEAHDYARLEIEVYRKNQKAVSTFKLVRNVEVPYPVTDYIDIYDSFEDALLTDDDVTTAALESQALLAQGINLPPRARCITSADNRVILGACTTTPTWSLNITESAAREVLSIANDFIGARVDLTLPNETVKQFEWVTNIATGCISSITQSNNLATVSSSGVNIIAGDWVYLTRTDSASGVRPRFAGWHEVISATGTPATAFTFKCNSTLINYLNEGVFDSAKDVNSISYCTTSGRIPVYAGTNDILLSTNEGNSSSPLISLMPRMGKAINAIMALSNSALIWAEYGNDVSPVGTIILKGLYTDWSAKFYATSGFVGRAYINGNLVTTRDSGFLSASTIFRGSRIVKSYLKYPEVFDNPDGVDASVSSSIIDVNPSDGEEITAMIPLMGTSTSSNAQLQSTVIVFKERSIYAVDISTGTFDKLETNGIGSPYPNSVSYTRSGLAFASESGLYRIDRQLRVSKIGGNIDKDWKERSTVDNYEVQGHHFAKDSQYKLSLSDGTVFVYNYEREIDNLPGAWTLFDNHPVAGGWANQGNKEYFASTKGRVFLNRSTGTVYDYVDDSETPIGVDIKFRPMNFGDPAIRKQVRHVNIAFRNMNQTSTNTTVSCAFDCSTDFTTIDSFTVDAVSASSISQLRFGIPAGRLNYLQMRIQNGTINEPIEVSGLTYKVGGLVVAGTKEAKTSKG